MYPKSRNGCERDCSSASDKVAGGNKANDFTVRLVNLMVVFHKTDERAKFSFVGVYPKQIVTVSKETDDERENKPNDFTVRLANLTIVLCC